MKHYKILIISLAIALSLTPTFSQQPKHDQGNFEIPSSPYWEKIKKSCDEFNKKKEKERKAFRMDFTGYELPTSIDQFKKVWYNEPISQGWTGTCWCFSGTSFFESEIYRIHKKKIKISEMFTVYWEYVEKARRFINERGDSYFSEGSQMNAVRRIWEKYGCVPAEAYTGLLHGQQFHDHHILIQEMESYLKSLKAANAWNEEQALSTIKSILNHYLGTPPEFVEVDGKKLTPLQYFQNYVKLNMDDYVDFMSLKQEPYNDKAIYDVPDNWWKCDNYYNINLDDFMEVVKRAAKNGYSIAIGGDVSETGYSSMSEVAMVPSYDIPSEYIDEIARQFRFSNHTTTDDHGIHLVGYMENKEGTWFLIKDSGSGSHDGKNEGFYFYHENYLKLKIMNLMLHKDAVKWLLEKFKN